MINSAEKIYLYFIMMDKSMTSAVDYIKAKPDIYVTLSSSDINRTKAFFAEQTNQRYIAILRYPTESSDICETNCAEDLLNFFKSKNIRCMVITDTTQRGFQLLDKGANISIRPYIQGKESLDLYIDKFIKKIKETSIMKLGVDLREYKLSTIRPDKPKINKVIVIGASTGGTVAVEDILKKMPADSPPIVIVQHMPPVFTRIFAERMHGLCKISVWEARDGDILLPGLCYIAPGGYQLTIHSDDGKIGCYYISCKKETNGNEFNCVHVPSVDVCFKSAALALKNHAVGVILTGMGSDGARGMLMMKTAGAYTIGQNEASCVVYGMPKVAYDTGAVCEQVHLNDMVDVIFRHV